MSTKSFYGIGQGSFYGGGMYGNGQPPVGFIEKELGPTSVVSFNDGLKNKPLKECVVNIEPIQNFHGYDAPWPAGGGKNLFSSEFIYGKNIASDGVITSTSNRSATIDPIKINGNTQYILSYTETGSRGVFYYDINDNFISYVGWEDKTVPFISPSNAAYVRFSTQGSAVPTNAQLEEGSVSTSYIPYSNICPITGWTGAQTTRCGKNQGFLNSTNVASSQRSTVTYDGGVVHVTSTGTYGRSGYAMKVKPGRQYTLSFEAKRGSAAVTGIYVNNKIGWSDHRYAIWVAAITESYSAFTVTFTADTDTLFFGIYPGKNDVDDHEIYVKNFQLEFGSESTDYEPYNSDIYEIAFPSEAGTVYGGVLDLTTGTLTVNKATVDLGTLNWKASSTPNCYFTSTQNVVYKSHDADMACSRYKYDGMRGFPPYYGDSGTITAYLTGTGKSRELYVHDDTLTNLEEFTAAMSGVQLVYELAEPVVYRLAPVQIITLLGTNNIWADTGDITIKYLAKK